MKRNFAPAAFALILTLTSTVGAGQLSMALAERVDQSSPDDRIPVWIELEDSRALGTLKSSTEFQAADRAGRYRLAYNRLTDRHLNAQRGLSAELNRWSAEGKVDKVKNHWLVNVISAEVSASRLAALAERSDVKLITVQPEIRLIQPEKVDHARSLASGAEGVEDNLRFIRADEAWAAGYTGQGRVVCSFDTGVDGGHPALAPNWKGNDGDHAAAWFFPRADGSTVPIPVYDCGYGGCNANHGSHTMGIICGHDDISGDTVGVAPGAEWISAAVIDINGVSILDAFEWAANPDGDPNTVADVPDVINHSWGLSLVGCENLFYDMIDATEALGIVNIFAAGNDGSTVDSLAEMTIRNPANRANDSLDCFAVGNINMVTGDSVRLYSSSSQGPSDCTPGAIKPNVTAPGVLIRSAYPGGGYISSTGTSMSAPHVAGMVALLRQKNPNATVDQIKTAILNSARDFNYSLPDNKFGWGVVDCMAALGALDGTNSEPNLRVYRYDVGPIHAGDTVGSELVLQNLGASVVGLSAVLADTPGLTVLDGSVEFGPIGQDDTLQSTGELRVAVSDTLLPGTIISATLTLMIDGGTSRTAQLFLPIAPPSERLFVTHNTGRVTFTVSNFGTYGMGPGAFFSAGGDGFTFEGGSNYLYECGLMIGVSPARVSDGVRNSSGEPDGDFAVLPGGAIGLTEPGPYATQQTFARFDDSRAGSPIGVEVVQETFAWADAPNDDFVILRYILTNPTAAPIYDIYAGLYMDWDVFSYSANAGGFDFDAAFLWTALNNFGSIEEPRGSVLLDGPLAAAYTNPATIAYYPDPPFDTLPDGFSESEKWWALTDGLTTADQYISASTDLLQVLASGPITLATGQSDTIAFALLAADDLDAMATSVDHAISAYADSLPTAVHVHTNDALPAEFSLHQNYPNPFNPTTLISFDLPRRSEFELTIYNVLGRVVEHVTGVSSAGRVDIEWDASGRSSGIYLYRLDAEGFAATRKMLLLK